LFLRADTARSRNKLRYERHVYNRVVIERRQSSVSPLPVSRVLATHPNPAWRPKPSNLWPPVPPTLHQTLPRAAPRIARFLPICAREDIGTKGDWAPAQRVFILSGVPKGMGGSVENSEEPIPDINGPAPEQTCRG
jgi:hypothetical protein